MHSLAKPLEFARSVIQFALGFWSTYRQFVSHCHLFAPVESAAADHGPSALLSNRNTPHRPMDPTARRLQHAALTAALRDNRLELRRAQRRAREAARVREWQLAPVIRNTAVIIFDLTGFRTEPAARFLMTIGRQRNWRAKTDLAMHAFVERTFLDLMTSAGAPAVAKLVNTDSPSDAPAMHAARRWVEEWDLFCWAELQNTERGVAPSTRALLVHLTAARVATGRPPPGTTTQSKVRSWATRFRRRWGGRFGSIPAKDCVPTHELMDKAFIPRSPRGGGICFVQAEVCSNYVIVCARRS
jgi:hypothetical protein